MDDVGLGPVEELLVADAEAGRVCDLSGRPEGDRCVRAAVLYDLCAGGRWRVHPRGVRLRGAEIDGDLVIDYGVVPVPLRLEACHLVGAVSLEGATVTALVLKGCTLEGPLSAPSLRADSLELDGSTFRAGVILARARVELDVRISGVVVEVSDPGDLALELHGAQVGGWVFLEDAAVGGAVRAMGARIGLGLEMRRTHITGAAENGCALDLRGLEAGRSLLMRQGSAAGSVWARNVRIGRHLDMSGTHLRGTDANGITFDGSGLGVGGGLKLHDGFRSAGAIVLVSATILQRLQLTDAIIEGHNDDGYAIDASGARIGGDADLDGALEATGAVRLALANIEGRLSLRGASLASPVDRFGNSLAGQGLQARGSVLLSNGFCPVGDVRLAGAVIGGQLSFANARTLPTVSLRGAQCAELADDPESWPPEGHLELRGFRFGAIKSETGWAQRLDWIRRQGFAVWSPEPYEQLAGYYSSIGDEDAARRIRVAKNRDELTHLWTVDPGRSRAYRLRRRVFGWLLGYGYQRSRAGWLLLATVLAAGLLFGQADRNQAMVPNVDDQSADEPCGRAYPCFDPWVYGADVVLPIIDFGQDDAWRPIDTPADGTAWPYIRWTLIATGWFLASVFVSALTGLIQKN